MTAPEPRERALGAALAAVLLLTLLVYRPVLGLGFIQLDDAAYVLANPHVRAGLSPVTLAWSLRSFEGGNWHPLTWLSHALDCQLFGLWAGGHHLDSLALHLLNVVLVFAAVRALTGAAWGSLGVAALFALHPMNVESVAWIAERKNVLSGTFFAGTLLAYACYARRPSRRGYLIVTAIYALGLLAKPMLVTVPFVLLLLDAWPLGRWRRDGAAGLVVEKLPWLALSAADSAVTVLAQSAGGAIVTLQEHPLAQRACVAAAGYLDYLLKLLWPAGLAVYYHVPAAPCRTLPVGTAVVTLLAVSGAAALLARKRPALAVGWAWFAGMLVPVSGLVQVGSQLIADRYVYHPMIGAALGLVFGLTQGLSARAAKFAGALLFLGCAALAWRTSVELAFWRDDESLFRRAIEVTGNNCTAEEQLGVALRNRGDRAGAVFHWKRALQQCPDLAPAHSHLGAMLAREGDLEAAIPHFAAAAALAPGMAPAMHYNIGLAFLRQGRRAEAVAEFERALALDPGHEPSLRMIRSLEPAR